MNGARPEAARRKIFEEAYRARRWGRQGDAPFFSGVGSTGAAAKIYIDTLSGLLGALAAERCGRPIRIVDLGCGDFQLAGGLLARLPGASYCGCDIVPALIRWNREHFGSARVRFQILDMVSQTLPSGDVCLIRQVLQHLPNRDVLRVVRKLRRYRMVFVTEGQPRQRVGAPNPDKTLDHDVRFDWWRGRGRGIELDRLPYNLRLKEVCRAVEPTRGREVIVTWRVMR